MVRCKTLSAPIMSLYFANCLVIFIKLFISLCVYVNSLTVPISSKLVDSVNICTDRGKKTHPYQSKDATGGAIDPTFST